MACSALKPRSQSTGKRSPLEARRSRAKDVLTLNPMQAGVSGRTRSVNISGSDDRRELNLGVSFVLNGHEAKPCKREGSRERGRQREKEKETERERGRDGERDRERRRVEKKKEMLKQVMAETNGQ